MNQGMKACREGWNGKGMFIWKQDGSFLHTDNIRNPMLKEIAESSKAKAVHLHSHIDMKRADGSVTIGWNASQIDMQATDWQTFK